MWNLVHATRSTRINPLLHSLAPILPPRRYASSKKPDVKVGSQGFRVKKGAGAGRGAALKVQRDANPGAFRPMPISQLSHPLFESRGHDELTLPVFEPAAVRPNAVGQALRFPMRENNPIKVFGVPKKMLLEFRILSRPCSVVRDATVALVDLLTKASQGSSLDARTVLTGRSGCGKSFLMLQAVEYCLQNGWMVLYIPRAVRLVDSSTIHVYDPRTQTYLQPPFSFQTLQRFMAANSSVVSSLTTQNELKLPNGVTIPSGAPLTDLIDAGLQDQTLSPIVLSILLEELGQQTQHPVLLAVDDFQALYCKTTYRDPHFVPIKSYHLSVPRLLLEYASGKKSFARGAVLGAVNCSDPMFQLPPELRDALDLPDHRPTGCKTKISITLQGYTEGLRKFDVPSELSVPEAAALFEVWMKDKAFHSSAYDGLFLSKYSASSGNARDFVWKGLLATLET